MPPQRTGKGRFLTAIPPPNSLLAPHTNNHPPFPCGIKKRYPSNPAMQHVVPQYETILSRISAESNTLFDEYQKLRVTNQQMCYDLQIGQDALAKLAKLEDHTSYQDSCLKEATDRAWNLETSHSITGETGFSEIERTFN
jgi:hypothetical protein